MKRHTVWKTVQTVLIAILLVVLVCLATVYMMLYQTADAADFTLDDYRKLKNEDVKYNYTEYYRKTLVSPAMVAVRAENAGQAYAVFTSDGLSAMEGELLAYYEMFFEKSDYAAALPDREGDALFSDVCDGDYLYIKYHTELPKSLLYQLSDSGKLTHTVTDERLYECIVFASSNYLPITPERLGFENENGFFLCMLTRDLSGHCHLYRYDHALPVVGKASFNTNFYLAYSSYRDTEAFSFLKNTTYWQSYAPLSAPTRGEQTVPVIGGRLSVPVIRATSGYRNLLSPDALQTVLRMLSMSPDKAVCHRETDGTLTYYEDGRMLKIETDGTCTFSITSYDYAAPLALSGEADALNCLGATSMFLDELPLFSDILASPGVSLVLSELTLENDLARVSYGFTYQNIPVIRDGTHGAASFELYHGKITGCTFSLVFLSGTNSRFQFSQNPMEWLALFSDDSLRFDLRVAIVIREDGDSSGIWHRCFSRPWPKTEDEK
ncbi:MAG: hypothetical protein KBS76_04085 [Ruminococcus sp.]|nr:hypothetical protein [Candidatus Apopatosoma intestinale]